VKNLNIFVSFLRQNYITIINTMLQIQIYKNSIIECELVAYVLNCIVHAALNK